MDRYITLIDKLKQEHTLSSKEWTTLIGGRTKELSDYLFAQAREIRELHYGKDIYVRGLIEFSNYCKNDCLYCGIREATGIPADTVLTKTRYFPAVRKAMNSACALLSSKAVKISPTQKTGW